MGRRRSSIRLLARRPAAGRPSRGCVGASQLEAVSPASTSARCVCHAQGVDDACLLDDRDPVAARELKERFARRWLALVDFHEQPPVEEAAACLALWVERPAEKAPLALRVTDHYTGTTYWLYDWDGDYARAQIFMDELAENAAGNVRMEPHHRGRRSISWELERPPTLEELRECGAQP